MADFSVSGSGSIDKAVNASSTGGMAGAGDFAGAVTVQSGGSITTGRRQFSLGGVYEGAVSGEGSDGILAQSIGGGGGNGGFSGALSFSNGGDAATNSVGGAGGLGSDGKLVYGRKRRLAAASRPSAITLPVSWRNRSEEAAAMAASH